MHNQQKVMVISKQFLFLQGATFCHLIFMQNLTEGLPPAESSNASQAPRAAVSATESPLLCCPQLRSVSKPWR